MLVDPFRCPSSGGTALDASNCYEVSFFSLLESLTKIGTSNTTCDAKRRGLLSRPSSKDLYQWHRRKGRQQNSVGRVIER